MIVTEAYEELSMKLFKRTREVVVLGSFINSMSDNENDDEGIQFTNELNHRPSHSFGYGDHIDPELLASMNPMRDYDNLVPNGPAARGSRVQPSDPIPSLWGPGGSSDNDQSQLPEYGTYHVPRRGTRPTTGMLRLGGPHRSDRPKQELRSLPTYPPGKGLGLMRSGGGVNGPPPLRRDRDISEEEVDEWKKRYYDGLEELYKDIIDRNLAHSPEESNESLIARTNFELRKHYNQIYAHQDDKKLFYSDAKTPDHRFFRYVYSVLALERSKNRKYVG